MFAPQKGAGRPTCPFEVAARKHRPPLAASTLRVRRRRGRLGVCLGIGNRMQGMSWRGIYFGTERCGLGQDKPCRNGRRPRRPTDRPGQSCGGDATCRRPAQYSDSGIRRLCRASIAICPCHINVRHATGASFGRTRRRKPAPGRSPSRGRRPFVTFSNR